MEKFVLVGHGSPRKSANNLGIMAGLLHAALHPGCRDECVKTAYMQFAEPDIASVIDECVAEGADRVVIHPFFLYSGIHVTKDIPALIKEARKRYDSIEFVYTEPLGIHGNLVPVVLERINASSPQAPGDIEKGASRSSPRRRT